MESFSGVDDGAFAFAKDNDALLTPSFSWSQLGRLGSVAANDFSAPGTRFQQDTNPFDQLFDMGTDMEVDFKPSPHDMSVPALSPDGSRTSESSMSGGSSNAFPASSVSSPDLATTHFSAPPAGGMSLPRFADDGMGSTDISPIEDKASARTPTFQDLLVKCSEVERLLDSLQYASFLGLNLDTASAASSLHKMLQAVDSAGDTVLTVASFICGTTGKSVAGAASAGGNSLQFTAPVDSINPAVLTRPTVQTYPTSSSSPAQQLALSALALALALRILDVCEVLATVQPSNPKSHHHILFLKRLDVNLVQVKSAVHQMELSKEMSREDLAQRAQRREADVQSRVKMAMEQATGFW